MKKLVKSVLMLSIASLAILSSCKKDDTTTDVADVKIDVTSVPTSPIEGGTVTLTITCTGNTDNNLKSISVTRSGGSLADKVVLSKTLSGTTSTQVVVDTLGSGTFIYTIALTGGAKTNSPATKTITVTTRPSPQPIDVTGSSVPLFGANNGPGTNPNFIQLSSPFTPFNTSTFAANKASIDLGFYFGDANKATLASPSDPTLQGRFSGLDWTSGIRTTSLYKTSLTADQFDVIAASNTDSVITAMAASVTTWVASVNLLNKGNVLMFKTKENKVGLLKIADLIGTNSTDAEMNVMVLVQK